HLEGKLRLQLVPIARELRVIALDQHRTLPRRLAGRGAGGEGGQELVLGEAQSPSAPQALAHEPLEAVRGTSFARRGVGDEGAAALVALDVAIALEIGQRARHGIRVDPQEAGQLAHGGQLHAWLERPRRDQVPDLGHELHVHGHGALPVHPEARRGRYAAALTRHGARRSLVADWWCSWGPGLPATGPA